MGSVVLVQDSPSTTPEHRAALVEIWADGRERAVSSTVRRDRSSNQPGQCADEFNVVGFCAIGVHRTAGMDVVERSGRSSTIARNSPRTNALMLEFRHSDPGQLMTRAQITNGYALTFHSVPALVAAATNALSSIRKPEYFDFSAALGGHDVIRPGRFAGD
jgi:hypothetical protein